MTARLAQGSDADTTTAEQTMTRTVVSARPDDRLLDVVFLMTEAVSATSPSSTSTARWPAWSRSAVAEVAGQMMESDVRHVLVED